ncbi:hypothetical protein TPA0907_55940 [Micromonospora humidisoli]|uniref:hypothetical protein n=1 Tax=Micromonospora sp. AKA109 TaxID=2733865 RepID=UPI0022C7490A|nr:hypothetical protein [Micromonospora sp. AKA109]GHJ11227.1 hypothetical protein TPA0907_55940 [Micromonospora sp. AKA109]
MTTAPANLMAVRRLLLDHLGPHGLDSAEVGIVGNPAHRGGYHCGSDRVVNNDYSVVESSRDRTGLTLYASGLDVGTFSIRVGGTTHNLQTFSTWCVAQCQAGAPDTRDIREIIYSPDGKVVRRWDRLGKRTSGDDSHLWHTHFSFFRDAIKAGRDLTSLFRRYLISIGLIQAPKPVEVPVAQDPVAWATTNRAAALLAGTPARYQIEGEKQPRSEPNRLAEQLARIEATAQAALGAVKGLDTSAILARIDQVAAAESARDAELAELVRAGQSGELAVDELLRRLGEVLTTGIAPIPGQARE